MNLYQSRPVTDGLLNLLVVQLRNLDNEQEQMFLLVRNIRSMGSSIPPLKATRFGFVEWVKAP